jgi:hypothetical protein
MKVPTGDERRAAERTVTADGAVADALAIGPDSSAAERTIDITTVGRRTDIPPKGVFSIVTGLGGVFGTAITCHPDVAKISFTGSTAVGVGRQYGAYGLEGYLEPRAVVE